MCSHAFCVRASAVRVIIGLYYGPISSHHCQACAQTPHAFCVRISKIYLKCVCVWCRRELVLYGCCCCYCWLFCFFAGVATSMSAFHHMHVRVSSEVGCIFILAPRSRVILYYYYYTNVIVRTLVVCEPAGAHSTSSTDMRS